jgi:carboxypeptidase family protein
MVLRIVVIVLLLLSGISLVASAQDASISGIVTDDSRTALPGSIVTAIERSTGRRFATVTDVDGEYRLTPVPAGRYNVQAERRGFSLAIARDVELPVGRDQTIAFSLRLEGQPETVIVSAPFVDISSSQIGGNIDRRQMESLPLQGRNWTELSMLVKGITANSVQNRPGVGRDQAFQLNVDGQQITQKIASSSFGQPRLSREAIAEFKIVTNLFDVTQGRSLGEQVQAVSRGGTNTLGGSLYVYARDDGLTAADAVAHSVLPYSNQQGGGSVGGPLIRGRLQYFGVVEYERAPYTLFLVPSGFSGQSFALPSRDSHRSAFVRVDFEPSEKTHVMVRGQYWRWVNPFADPSSNIIGGGTNWHPSQAAYSSRNSDNFLADWSRVLGDDIFLNVAVGLSRYHWLNRMASPAIEQIPSYVFPNVTIGGRENFPQDFFDNTPSVRYQLTWHRARHNFKIGGEFLYSRDTGVFFRRRRGEYVFNATPPDLATRIPAEAYNDPGKWNLTGLDATLRKYDVFFANDWTFNVPRPIVAAWFGDIWRLSRRLTLNAGVRWDDDFGETSPPGVTETDVLISNGQSTNLDVGYKNGIHDHKDVAPRFGFAYNVHETNDLVIRGGTGLFFGTQHSNAAFAHQMFNGQRVLTPSFLNDGKPGFLADPLRGVTAADFLAGAARLPAQALQVITPGYRQPYTWHSTIGIERQLGEMTAVAADLIGFRSYREGRSVDPNLFFDAASGYNLNPVLYGRPNPNYAQFEQRVSTGTSDYLALATALTRRYRGNFEAGLTYTLMFFANDTNNGESNITANNMFNLDGEWARTLDFQRHTLRINGMYQFRWNISVAALYFFGSGNYYQTFVAGSPFGLLGVNRYNAGAPIAVAPSALDRFDGPPIIQTGTAAPRDALRGFPLHKVDVNVRKDLRLTRQLKLTGLVEIFNLFNHANYGAYDAQIGSATFGQPRQNLNDAFLPRVVQLAARFSF